MEDAAVIPRVRVQHGGDVREYNVEPRDDGFTEVLRVIGTSVPRAATELEVCVSGYRTRNDE